MKKPFTAYNGTDKYAFISYAHKVASEVYPAINALHCEGYKIWYDEGIHVGEDWAEKIGKRMENASCIILFLSKRSAKSTNVQREISYAKQLGLPFITVEIGKLNKLDPELERFLHLNQSLKYLDYKNLSNFVNAVSEPLKKASTHGEETTPYKDKRITIKRRKIRRIIWAIILLLILLFILVYKSLVGFVPYVVGMYGEEASAKIAGHGYNASLAMDYSDEEEFGRIFKQSEYGDTFKFLPVVVTESLGSGDSLTDVPDTVGFHISDGISKLADANMLSFAIKPVESKDYATAYITAQSIPGGVRVSSKNTIILDVATEGDSVSFDYKGESYTIPTDGEYQVDLEDTGLRITPRQVYGVNMKYTETDPMNAEASINATITMSIHASRVNVDPYGRYYGEMRTDCAISGTSQAGIGWKILSKTLADEEGNINISALADPLRFTMEEFNESKYKEFVKTHTGSDSEAKTFNNPICMSLNEGVALTNEGLSVKALNAFLSSASLFTVSLPTMDQAELSQPYSVIIDEQGYAYVTFYGKSGESRSMQIISKAVIEQANGN